MKKHLAILCFSVCSLWATGFAEDEQKLVYKIDRAHSSVNFVVTHFKTPVRGSFSGVTGDIVLDAGTPEESEVTQVIIPATTINTNNKTRDEHMRDKYIQTAEFPQIRFQSAHFKPKGRGFMSSLLKKDTPAFPKKWVLSGNLEFMGKTRSVDIDVELLGEGPGMKGTYLTSWRGTTTLKRKKWGISFGPMDGLIGEAVDIELLIEAGRPYEEAENDTDPEEENES